jgi:hypothetical protein
MTALCSRPPRRSGAIGCRRPLAAAGFAGAVSGGHGMDRQGAVIQALLDGDGDGALQLRVPVVDALARRRGFAVAAERNLVGVAVDVVARRLRFHE